MGPLSEPRILESVLVVGTGALAHYLPLAFPPTGIPVIILAPGRRGWRHYFKNGAILDGLGSFPVQITGSQVDGYQAKFALVLVKSWQTQRAARQLSACLAQDGVVLTLQNGLGNDAILAGKLDWSRVARGVTTLGATLLAPGLVRQAGMVPFRWRHIHVWLHFRICWCRQALMYRWSTMSITALEQIGRQLGYKPLDGFVANKKRGIAQPSYRPGIAGGGRPRDRLGGRNAGRGFAIPGPRLCHRRGGLAHSGEHFVHAAGCSPWLPYRDRCDQWGDCSEGGRRGTYLAG